MANSKQFTVNLLIIDMLELSQTPLIVYDKYRLSFLMFKVRSLMLARTCTMEAQFTISSAGPQF